MATLWAQFLLLSQRLAERQLDTRVANDCDITSKFNIIYVQLQNAGMGNAIRHRTGFCFLLGGFRFLSLNSA